MEVRGEGMKIRGQVQGKGQRKDRSDKKIRIGPYFPKPLYERLNRLSRICGVSDQELLLEMAEMCLNHPDIILYFQRKHNINEGNPFFSIPTYIDGKLMF